jgi:hypothetical protein
MSHAPIGNCAGCGLLLPLSLPEAGEPSRSWACAGCGVRYDGNLDRNQPLELIEHVRPYRMAFCLNRAEQPPSAIAEFVAKLLPEDYRGWEKRGYKRLSVVTPVAVMPLSESLEPSGSPFMVLARNISRSGIALVSTRSVSATCLAVELPRDPEESLQVVVRVVRCRPLRSFYEIAGSFVTKMVPPREFNGYE